MTLSIEFKTVNKKDDEETKYRNVKRLTEDVSRSPEANLKFGFNGQFQGSYTFNLNKIEIRRKILKYHNFYRT